MRLEWRLDDSVQDETLVGIYFGGLLRSRWKKHIGRFYFWRLDIVGR